MEIIGKAIFYRRAKTSRIISSRHTVFSNKIILIICASLVLLLIAKGLGFGTVENTQAILEQVNSWPDGALYALLFLWCFLLFLTVAPLGSFTILAAGFFLGPIAGPVQFLALCLSSYVLHIWTKPRKAQPAYAQIIENKSALKVIEKFRGYPVTTVSVLRLVPVIPSCVCVLTCSAFAIPGRALLKGTLLTGWVRPILLAYIGSQALNIIDLVK